MKHAVLGFATILVSGLLALSREPHQALACTGPGPVETMLSSSVVIEGRVTSVVASGEPGFDRAPFAITLDVARAHRGAVAGESIVATGYIPIPGRPIMCPQLPQNLLGKYVVAGLSRGQDPGGGLVADAWNMPFIGDGPTGDAYEYGRTIAEMITDSNPAAPLLTLEPALATCGQQMELAGRRFPKGKYLVKYGFGRPIALVDVGPDGAFNVSTSIVHELCRDSRANSRLISFHVFSATNGVPMMNLDLRGPTEVAAAPLAGAIDREPRGMELAVMPSPARCTEPITIRGTGFEAGERLVLRLGADVPSLRVNADDAGSFSLRTDIPAELCDRAFVPLQVFQSGFENVPVPLTGRDVFLSPLPPTPVAPALGTGYAAGGPTGKPWHLMAWAGAALVSASCAAATIRLRRRN